MKKLLGIFLTMGVLVWASTAGAVIYDVHVETTGFDPDGVPKLLYDTDLGIAGNDGDAGILSLDFSFDCDLAINDLLTSTTTSVLGTQSFDDGNDPVVTTTVSGNLVINSSPTDTSKDTIVWSATLNWDGAGINQQFNWLLYVPEGFYTSCGEDCDIPIDDRRVRIAVGGENYGIAGNIACAPVPEPSTMLLLGAGLAGLAGVTWRRKKNG